MAKVAIVPSSELGRSWIAEDHVSKKIKCTLCDQEFFKFDPLIKERKARHAEKHTRGWNMKAQKNGGGNNTIGVCDWEDVN